MRRADRLFDIIQALRAATRPMTAATLAAQLEVATRTIYRDIAALQARRVPIDGAAGVGYILRAGFDFPPLHLTADEIDALVVGAGLVARLRDPVLQQAASSLLAKATGAFRPDATATAFLVSDGSAAKPAGIELADARRAIRDGRKLWIAYRDAEGRPTCRTIWPLALVLYVDVTLIGGWCELRQALRHFRAERITESRLLSEPFTASAGLRASWAAEQARMMAASAHPQHVGHVV